MILDQFGHPVEGILRPNYTCNGFCYEQASSSLRMANQSPAFSETFARIADHWVAIAKACDGKLDPQPNWCHELSAKSKAACRFSSPFVAQVLATCLPEDREPSVAAGAYRTTET